MRRLAWRKRVTVYADSRTGSEFGADAVIGERHRVIARFGFFSRMIEAGKIAAAGLFGIARIELHLAGDRPHQEVAEVGMTGAGKMRMRETEDRRILVPVAGRPAIAFLARFQLRVRTQLDHAERNHGARKGMAFAAGADEGIDRGKGARAGRVRLRNGRCGGNKGEQASEQQGRALHRGLAGLERLNLDRSKNGKLAQLSAPVMVQCRMPPSWILGHDSGNWIDPNARNRCDETPAGHHYRYRPGSGRLAGHGFIGAQ
jgi:hypothetical protein